MSMNKKTHCILFKIALNRSILYIDQFAGWTGHDCIIDLPM